MQARKVYFFTAILSLVLCLSCSRNTQKVFNQASTIDPSINNPLVVEGSVLLNSEQKLPLHLKYLGAGGYFFECAEDAFLIDPFFSPHQLVPMAFGRIGTNPLNVTKGLSDIDTSLKSKVSGIFVTHSHYDHLMDVPYVFNHFLDTTNANNLIYGSGSTRTTIKFVVDSTKIVTIDSMVSTNKKVGRWVYLRNRHIRVMPVRTEHAPHYTKGIKLNLYEGQARTNLKYTNELQRMRPKKWSRGDVYGYLIDHLDNNSDVDFRMFLLSSASSPPNGQLPEELIDEHQINLAILGAASFENVDDYPEAIIDHLDPQRILITHWEDLFKPYMHYPSRMIRANNMTKFLIRLNDIYPVNSTQGPRVFFPEPGTHFYVK